jgi:hypothetical protein
MTNQLRLNEIQDRIFNYIYYCLRVNGADIYDIKERDYTIICEVDLNTDEAGLLGNNFNDNEAFDDLPTLSAFIRMTDYVNDNIKDYLHNNNIWETISEYDDGEIDIDGTYKILIVYYAYYWVFNIGYSGFLIECKKRFENLRSRG